MKRVFLLCLLLTLLLAGCASATADSTPPAPPPTDTAASASATPAPSATPEPTAAPTALPTPTEVPAPMPLIALDAGHGGEDLGARHFQANGQMDFYEAQVTFSLIQRIADILHERGYGVLLTRMDEELLNDSVDVNEDGELDFVDDLLARVDKVNAAGADLLLSIHENAYEGPGAEEVGGLVTYYCGDRPFAAESQRFGAHVQEQLLAAYADLDYDIMDRGVLDDGTLGTGESAGRCLILLGERSSRILQPSQMPGVLNETGFITHAVESQFMIDPDALARFARAYADAVDAYFAEAAAP